ncbi:MAG: c-type cytochrome [Woeseiaceae bacterium]
MSRDQKFFDVYSIVLGVSAAVALAFIVLSMKMADLTQGVYIRDADEYQAAVAARIKPFGQVYLPGEEHTSSAPIVETAVEPAPVATALSGPQVYNEACIACHGAGIGGAPILGDVDGWTARLAKGNDVLEQNALKGFTDIGYMPPKGGRVDLSDEEILDAVTYMIDQSN